MSASVPPQSTGAAASGAAQDPSMEDILASIRRILSEDEQPAAKPSAAPPAEPDVLPLDESMLVAEPPDTAAKPDPEPPPAIDQGTALVEAISARGEPLDVVPVVAPADEPPPAATQPAPPPAAPPPPAPVHSAPPGPDRLIAPEAEAATATSLNTLLRTLESGRQSPPVAVWRGGPTLEDMVREEIRPLLKAWLDQNLPPMVERLVRAEIERVVGRAVG
jgi:cell pole-organizing protein PopZ